MKKVIFSLLLVLSVSTAFSQYLVRHNYAQRDTLRTLFKMAAIDVAVERFDTATNQSLRLAADILRSPNDPTWLDIFMYPAVILLTTATPTDAAVKSLTITLWNRVALLNTRR